MKSATLLVHAVFASVFWATVYKTVRPMCLSCLSHRLSATLVYCGQTAGWMKTSLGTEVGLGQGHFVLDGDPPPPQKGGTAVRSSYLVEGFIT